MDQWQKNILTFHSTHIALIHYMMFYLRWYLLHSTGLYVIERASKHEAI
jgi:hypothetical protein